MSSNSSYKIIPPDLAVCKSYEIYKKELAIFEITTDLPKAKLGAVVASRLPNDCALKKNLRDKFYETVDIADLTKEDGLKLVTEFLDKELGESELEKKIRTWDDFEDCCRGDKDIEEFVSDFDLQYQRAVNASKVNISSEVRAFMVLKRSNVTKVQRMLILSKLDKDDKENMFNNMSKELKLVLGGGPGTIKEPKEAVKFEESDLPSEEVLWSYGYTRRGAGGARGRGRARPGAHRGEQRHQPYPREGGRYKNRPGEDGKPLKCHQCESIYHLLSKCPEKDKQEEVYKAILLTKDEEERSLFTREARNSGALDTCCTSSVASQHWLDDYMNSLEEELKGMVSGPYKGEKEFRFGDDGTLGSKGRYIIPARVGDKVIKMEIDIVGSDIPLLISKKAMKKMKMVLDMNTDTATVFGSKIDLVTTTSGHYCLPLLGKQHQEEVRIEEVFAVNLKQIPESEQLKWMTKLHRQFGHTSKPKFVNFLKDAGAWHDGLGKHLDKIINSCEGCIKKRRNPDKPAVSLPMANYFNEKLAIDLKIWKGRYILHMIDMWSRLTISAFIPRKRPRDVIEKLLEKWVSYFGVPKAILNDNGGEFTGEEIRQVKDMLNVVDLTTGAESPWQNGLCERNHATVDVMLERLIEDFPKMSEELLLCWANMAKNSIQMIYGYSSNQLVYGVNPNLPNVMTDGPPALEGRTMSEVFANHINALHASRRAFIETESSERVRKALLRKIRTNNQEFNFGDRVFYKRENAGGWKGPAKVVLQDGKVIFVRHGSSLVRVSPNRIVKQGEEFSNEDIVKQPVARTENKPEPNKELIPDDSDDEAAVSENNERKRKASESQDGEAGKRSRQNEGSTKINLRRDDKGMWQLVTDGEPVTEEVHMVMIPRDQHSSAECLKAKKTELSKLADFEAFRIVDDEGQARISTTWVLWNKGEETRARLCARGYEESEDIPSDSPTIDKPNIRLLILIATSYGWNLGSSDVKSAFLQGQQLDRKVVLVPPREANVEKGKLWELQVALYGLDDASLQFFRKCREVLLNLGCKQSSYDPALFFLKSSNGSLLGLIALHVDDFLHAGTETFKLKVVKKLHETFKMGSITEKKFTYTGFDLEQETGHVRVSQDKYTTEKIEVFDVKPDRARNPTAELTPEEVSTIRKVAGKIGWLARGSRPDLIFSQIEMSTKGGKSQVRNLIHASKLIRKIKDSASFFLIKNLGHVKNWRLVVSTDASLSNLNDGVDSTGAYIILMTDDEKNCAPLAWNGSKIKRIVSSTLEAETLALVEGVKEAVYLREVVEEVFGLEPRTLEVHALVDSKSTVDAIHSTAPVEDRRLRRDIGIIKQTLNAKEIHSVKWIPGRNQLADGMTKRTASCYELMEILQKGKLSQ